VTISKASVFHNPDAAVLKLGIESIGLRMLHKRVNQNLAHITTYPGFKPHMTVAYMVKKDDDPYYYQTFFDDSYAGTQFEVDKCVYSTASGKKSIITFDGMVYPLGIGRAARIASSVEEACVATW
jgi:2'-5' RNA ligase